MSKRKKNKKPDAGDLPRVSKQDVRRYADEMARTTTSHGTKIDPAAFAARIWKSVRRCVLCHPERKPAYVWGVWIPGKESDPIVRIGLADHQARTIFYGLCVNCYQTKDAHLRVEEAISDRYLQEANLRASLDAAGATYTNEAFSDGTRWVAIEGKSG